MAKNINVYDVAIKPNFVNDKKKFILKIRMIYPDLDFHSVSKNLIKINTFMKI